MKQLTKAQKAVAVPLCMGHSNKQIAREIHRAAATVKFHVETMIHEFHAQNRTGLVAKLIVDHVVTRREIRQ